MALWKVCGKWELNVDLERPDATSGHRPFHEFPMADMGRHILCREALLRQLPRLETVRELFGGLGLTATVIRNLHHPNWHRITEIHPGLVEHLRANGFDSAQENAFTAAPRLVRSWDLVDADFGLFTVLQWARSLELQKFMQDLFAGGHRYVMLTDESVSRLGANRDKYAKVLDCLVDDIGDYVNGWSQEFSLRYGYSVKEAAYYRGAVTTLWTPGENPTVVPFSPAADYAGVEVA